MKIAASVLMVVLALVVGIVPLFTHCSGSLPIENSNGKTVPMKCHWTAQAEIGTALPLLAVGAVLGVSKRKETWRGLGLLGAVLGVVVLLLPTNLLIGVCANPDMICNVLMKPILTLGGTLIIALSLGVVYLSMRKEQGAAIAEAVH